MAWDSADSAARVVASMMVMRYSSWLQVTGLSPEMQTSIQDLPIDGNDLFSKQTDTRLHKVKDTKAISIHWVATHRN